MRRISTYNHTPRNSDGIAFPEPRYVNYKHYSTAEKSTVAVAVFTAFLSLAVPLVVCWVASLTSWIAIQQAVVGSIEAFAGKAGLVTAAQPLIAGAVQGAILGCLIGCMRKLFSHGRGNSISVRLLVDVVVATLVGVVIGVATAFVGMLSIAEIVRESVVPTQSAVSWLLVELDSLGILGGGGGAGGDWAASLLGFLVVMLLVTALLIIGGTVIGCVLGGGLGVLVQGAAKGAAEGAAQSVSESHLRQERRGQRSYYNEAAKQAGANGGIVGAVEAAIGFNVTVYWIGQRDDVSIWTVLLLNAVILVVATVLVTIVCRWLLSRRASLM